MSNLRIVAKMALGFGIVVVLTILMGWYSLDRQQRIRDFSEQMNTRDFQTLAQIRALAETEDRMHATRKDALANYLLRAAGFPASDPARDQEAWRRAKDDSLRSLQAIETAAARYQESSLNTMRAAQWRKISALAAEAAQTMRLLEPEVETHFGHMNRGLTKEVASEAAELVRLRRLVEDKLGEAGRAVEEQVQLGRSSIDAFFDEARTSTLIALAVATLLAIVCAIFIQRSITRPLGAFMQVIQRIGKGDLTQEAQANRGDELGDLARSLNQMAAGLRDVAGQTRTAAENLGVATAEILASTQQQAASTAEQAAAVQQTNATMTEVSQAGAQISERAKAVAAGAEATSASSASGLDAVRGTTTTMEAIREQAEAVAGNVVTLSEKTQAVGEIIATVNDIAEQSHLLALNAAIEAAAAGEHGRSFAVVASEMKNLADQSREATVQVRSILGDIQKGINSSVMLTEEAVKRVESGRQQADVADRAIRQLSDNIQQSVQAFQQIVAGSSQQQIGFDQVTQALKNIAIASEQTASSTRQSEQAAANLNALAHQLRSAVERYRI